MDPVVKRRGRPSKKKESNPQEEKRLALFKHMEEIEYICQEPEPQSYLQLRMEKRFDLLQNSLFDKAKFNSDTERLRELANEYFQSFEKPALEETEFLSLLPNELSSDDEGELEHINYIEKETRTTRKAYMKWKKPIENFQEIGIEALPDEKKAILLEHNDEIFNNNLMYQEQIELVLKLIYDPKKGSGYSTIGALFGVSKATICTHHHRMNKIKKARVGRPGILNETQMETLIIYIKQCYEQKASPNLYHLVDYIFNTFEVSIKINSLRSIITNTKELKSVVGKPLEGARAEVSVETVLAHYQELDRMLVLEKIPPEFFYNVDESGFQDFSDANEQVVIVPYDVEGDVFYSVDRTLKRASMIGCICLDGTTMKPLIVSPNKTISRMLHISGYNENTCLVVHQENGFVNNEIFAFWAEHIFFPEVARKRNELGYEGLVVLTLDGCTAHLSDRFLDSCTFYNVYPWFEPAGTSDQVQALDLGIFGNQKKLKSRFNPNKSLTLMDKTIIEIVNSWQRSTCPSAVVSAFNQAGIYVYSSSDETIVRCAAEKGRAVRGVTFTNSDNIIIGRKTYKIPSFSNEKVKTLESDFFE